MWYICISRCESYVICCFYCMYFYVEKKGQWVTCNKLIYIYIYVFRFLEKNSNCHKLRQNILTFHKQKKIWTLSVHSILMLWRPNVVRNCSIVCINCINWYLHNVDTIIIWVVMSWWIIRSYPYPQNSGITVVVTIFFLYLKKQTAI